SGRIRWAGIVMAFRLSARDGLAQQAGSAGPRSSVRNKAIAENALPNTAEAGLQSTSVSEPDVKRKAGQTVRYSCRSESVSKSSSCGFTQSRGRYMPVPAPANQSLA